MGRAVVTMQYRRLGRTGFRVSAVGLGCNAFGSRADESAARAILDRALDAGVTLIDTADMYADQRSEEIIGVALSGRRDAVVLSTKGGSRVGAGPNDEGATRHHLVRALEASLRRLRTDYVDLYTVHFPDPYTPDEETMSTLDSFVRAGKIRYVCASNFAAWQVMRSLWASERIGAVTIQAVQASYSLLDRTVETELRPMCQDRGLGLVAFWPLGGGLLTGKYVTDQAPPADSRVLTQPVFQRSFTRERHQLADEFASIARECDVQPAALALSWVLHQETVSSVLVGSTKPDQLSQNLRALDVALDPEMLERLDVLSAAARRTPFR